MSINGVREQNQTKPVKKQIKKKSSKPVTPDKTNIRSDFYCCRCSRSYKKQKGNFPATQSPLFSGNNGYLTTCNECFEELFEHYRHVLGEEKEAVKRMCLKYDYYWSEDIYEMLANTPTGGARMRTYVSKNNLIKYIGKTYDDTLDEQKTLDEERGSYEKSSPVAGYTSVNHTEEGQAAELTEEDLDEGIVAYWGTGLRLNKYIELETRRKYWLSQYPDGTVLDPGAEALLRQICGLEIDINHLRAEGKSTEKLSSTLNGLLGSMNLQPSQKRETAEENYIPFGMEIARWEEDKPVIDPDPEFEDVDGFKKNITAWFLGQLCRMVGIRNKYSDIYQEELEKYTIERPKFEDDDDESTFDDMFGRELISPGGDDDG